VSYYYTVVLKSSEPVNPQLGWIWGNPTIGQFALYVGSVFTPFVGGEPFTATEDIYWKGVSVQESEPTSPEPGDMWLKESINQCYIYGADWLPFVGG